MVVVVVMVAVLVVVVEAEVWLTISIKKTNMSHNRYSEDSTHIHQIQSSESYARIHIPWFCHL